MVGKILALIFVAVWAETIKGTSVIMIARTVKVIIVLLFIKIFYSTSFEPFGYFFKGSLPQFAKIGVMNFHEAMISSVEANKV